MNATVLPDPAAVARAAAEVVVEASAAAGDRFAVCLTGGSVPRMLYRLLATPQYAERIDWARWDVFYGDERQVPLHDAEASNHGAAHIALLDHVPVAAARIHTMTDADQYEGLLRAYFGEAPRFDLLLLGLGPDGHVASLFPGSVSLLEEERWVIEPPDVVGGMERITLTLPALNAARRTLFMACGPGKHAAIARIRAGEHLPAALVRNAAWLVDEPAWSG
jgi:6-phosphogluconolactonase